MVSNGPVTGAKIMRKFRYVEDEYISNWFSNALEDLSTIGQIISSPSSHFNHAIHTLEDIEALFRHFGIKSIEELKEVLEISQKITQEYNNDKEI